MSFFEELKRRNVVRMAVLYAVASWLILQIADVLFDQLHVPDWAFRFVLGLLLLGFPLVLIFSWVYELTPEGLKRERDIDRGQSITHQTGHKLNIAIIVLLVLAIGGLIANRLIPQNPPLAGDTAAMSERADAGQPEEGLSIAVLPFVNMSGDPDNEYFSDGLSEELLNTLVQIRELKVTGRTSSFAFKGKNLDLRDVGEKLNVANVLEGSVRKAAKRVRITAQLIKTTDGYHLWSETFDRELDDIFAIQQEIAEKVAAALSVTLLGKPAEASGETHNTEAYQAYLRGAHLFHRAPDDLETLQAARAHYEQALALEPGYVAPRWGLFGYWDRMNRNGFGAYTDTVAEMKISADKLEQTAPGSVEAMLARARVAQVSLDRARSAEMLREARDRFPGSVETNMRYGGAIFSLGQAEEGLAAAGAAVELDPLALDALTQLAAIEYQLGQCEEVEKTTLRAREIEPDSGRVRSYMAYCLLIRGDDAAEAMRWLQNEPVAFLRRTGKAIALHRLGRQQEAEEEKAQMMSEYGDSASFQYAQVYAQWGQPEKALEWLETGLDIHDPGIINIAVDRLLDPLRADERFQELLRRAGFEEIPDPLPRN
jgi:serine/threonine-protein kinase